MKFEETYRTIPLAEDTTARYRYLRVVYGAVDEYPESVQIWEQKLVSTQREDNWDRDRWIGRLIYDSDNGIEKVDMEWGTEYGGDRRTLKAHWNVKESKYVTKEEVIEEQKIGIKND